VKRKETTTSEKLETEH